MVQGRAAQERANPPAGFRSASYEKSQAFQSPAFEAGGSETPSTSRDRNDDHDRRHGLATEGVGQAGPTAGLSGSDAGTGRLAVLWTR